MGNCLRRCFGRFDRKKYMRTRYNVERDFSIEFENLMDEDHNDEDSLRPVSDRERELLCNREYEGLLHEQKSIDAKIDNQLAKQEEELRMEEEAYYEAKREAARVAKLRKAQEHAARTNLFTNGPKTWIPDDEEWDVAGGEDDFESFLESVKARSLTSRIQQQVQFGRADGSTLFGDTYLNWTKTFKSTSIFSGLLDKESNSSTRSKERSQTEGSSIDLEWEHEAGVEPQEPKERSNTEENLAEMTNKPESSRKESSSSTDLEWDNTDALEKEQLIASDIPHGEIVDR